MAALPLPPQRRYQGKVVLVTGPSVVCLYACIRVTACVSTRLARPPLPPHAQAAPRASGQPSAAASSMRGPRSVCPCHFHSLVSRSLLH